MMLSGATRSVGDIWPAKISGSDSTELPCSKGAVRLEGALIFGTDCWGTGMTCWLRGVAIGGNFGTPTASPDGVGPAAGIGAICASTESVSPASAGSIAITSTAKILRNIWDRDLLDSLRTPHKDETADWAFRKSSERRTGHFRPNAPRLQRVAGFRIIAARAIDSRGARAR